MKNFLVKFFKIFLIIAEIFYAILALKVMIIKGIINIANIIIGPKRTKKSA